LSIPLPSIEGSESIIEETAFLEDIDVILDGTVAPPSTPASIVAETRTRSTVETVDYFLSTIADGRTNLQDVDKDLVLNETKDRNFSSTLTELQQRLDKFLEDELKQAYGGQNAITPVRNAKRTVDSKPSSSRLGDVKKSLKGEPHPPKRRWNWAKQLFNKAKSQQVSKQARSGDLIHKQTAPVVWVIQPFHKEDDEEEDGRNGNDRLTFKFTADTGTFLVLKDNQAFSCIEIMKKYTRKLNCNTFFQLYTVNGRESQVVQSDRISELMLDICKSFFDRSRAPALTVAADEATGPKMVVSPELDAHDQNNQSFHITQIMYAKDAPHSTRNKDGISIPTNDYKGIVGYLMRRRWKHMIKDQMKTAMGLEDQPRKKKTPKWLFYPFWIVWKAIRRSGRE
jgi:hypothetical protein